MLLKLLGAAAGCPVAVVFDAGRHTFRNDMYAEYKANRAECPEDLVPQMPLFRQFVSLLGLPSLEVVGFEADDLIGTLAAKAHGEGYEVVVVTADKDLMQVVGPGITLWDTMRDRRVAEAQVVEKFGVGPAQVCEVLALIGDASDNIPGVSGIGPKTAATLIQQYQSVEQLLLQASEVRDNSAIRNRKKIADALEQGADTLRLSRRLVEIDAGVPMDLIFSPEQAHGLEKGAERLEGLLARKDPDWNGLSDF
jgi:DNA polymerase-1